MIDPHWFQKGPGVAGLLRHNGRRKVVGLYFELLDY